MTQFGLAWEVCLQPIWNSHDLPCERQPRPSVSSGKELKRMLMVMAKGGTAMHKHN